MQTRRVFGLTFSALHLTSDFPPPLANAFGRCGYSFRKHYNLADDQEKINLWTTFETSLGDDHEFYAEAAYYSVDVAEIANSPSFPVLRFEVIPAENPGNFLGIDGIYLGRPFGQNFSTQQSFRDYETYRFGRRFQWCIRCLGLRYIGQL